MAGLAALNICACSTGATGPHGEKGQPGASCTMTTNEDNGFDLICRGFEDNVMYYNYSKKNYALSVRCLKDLN